MIIELFSKEVLKEDKIPQHDVIQESFNEQPCSHDKILEKITNVLEMLSSVNVKLTNIVETQIHKDTIFRNIGDIPGRIWPQCTP